jgi:hypothetical protein
LVSLLKFEPVGGDQGNPNTRTRLLEENAGLVQIEIDGLLVYEMSLLWIIEVTETVPSDVLQPYVSADCVQHSIEISIGVEMEHMSTLPNNDRGALNVAISDAISETFGVEPFGPLFAPFVQAFGPLLKSAYSVNASWGIDHVDLSQLGPIVVASNRLGRSSFSSHGYWVRVYSDVSTNPSKTVNFEWRTKIRRSGFINIENHIKNAIIQKITLLVDSLKQNNQNLEIICSVNPLPPIEDLLPIEQLVVDYEEPPESVGDSCEVLDPLFGVGGANEPLDIEPRPADNRWDTDDPAYPPTYFPPYEQ